MIKIHAQPDDFIFIHMMRTGGSSMGQILANDELFPHMAFTFMGYHRPLSSVGVDIQNNNLIIGNVRNPWDWYVSLYYHALNTIHPMKTQTTLCYLLGRERYDFKTSIKKLIDTSWMIDEYKMNILDNWPTYHKWDKWYLENITKDDIISYFEGDVGFFTWLFERMYLTDNTNLDDINFLRTESLLVDFIDFLKRINYYNIDKVEKHIPHFENNRAAVGTGNPYRKAKDIREINYKQYYDDELKELILLKDKKYIEHFNYKY